MGTDTTNTQRLATRFTSFDSSKTTVSGTLQVVFSAWGSGWMAEQMGCPHEPPTELFGKATTTEQRLEWSQGWHYSRKPPTDKKLNVWGKEVEK